MNMLFSRDRKTSFVAFALACVRSSHFIPPFLFLMLIVAASLGAEPVFIEKAGPPREVEGGVLFTFEAPEAANVFLAGQFNNWTGYESNDSTGSMEQAAPNGVWYKVAQIPSGRTEYKFVITRKDGGMEWTADPFVPGTGDHGNSIYDPENPPETLEALISCSAARISMVESKSQLMIAFLNERGTVSRNLLIPPIVMDGVPQKDLVIDSSQPGRLANGTIVLTVECAGARSVSLTYEAEDGGLHEWDLGVPGNDSYYGGGERFNSINQKGYILPMRSMDHPGEKGAVSYKPVPFIMNSSGFGVWVDSFTPGTFDLNATERSTCHLNYTEYKLRVVFIAGPDLSDTLKEYTALTGRPPVPPVWSFAPWKSRNVHNDREEVLEDVEKYRQYDLPGSVLVIDSPWERGYNDFVLNDEQFTDPRAMFDRVEELGFYTCLWLTPFVNSENVQDMHGIAKGPSSNFQEAADEGFLVKNSDGEVMISDWWKGKGGLVDFTNPEAVQWWFEQLDKTKKWGVKAWKCDDGEGTFVLDAVLHDGSTPAEMKGRFGYLYLETMQKYIDERMDGDGVLFARPGFAGTQKFPYCWAGDNHAGWDFENGLPGVIRAGQTAALSGISLWGHDISGYHGTQTPELFNRWTQFGCFSPLMQLHMTSNLGPWSFGEESLDIYRQYAKLHTQLFPYIYAAAKESHETGMPIIRPMVLAFQSDPIASREDFQYLFGPSILVAPIYQPGTHRSVYIPRGTWIDWWTGERIAGGRYIEAYAPMDRIPLYVAAGSVIPMLPADVDTLVPASSKLSDDVVTMDDRRILQIWPGAPSVATTEGISVEAASPVEQRIDLTISVSQSRPLEVHLMHQRLTMEQGATNAPDSVRWDDGVQATVLRWKSLAGEAQLRLSRN
ncbi:hypothetical protein KQI84_03000 [bacterium]|nr:hypothetical protein [bacterium]